MSEREREATEGKPQAVGEDEAGIALEDAFRLLSLAPKERLLSLTFKLGRSRTEELVHAMSLMGLGNEAEALAKLRALGDTGVARRLAETLESRGRGPEAARRGGGSPQEPGADSAVELARIFWLLADEKLCLESRRDRAYRAALRACSRQTGNGEGRGTLARLTEEAREACGWEFGAASGGASSCEDGETLRSGAGAFPHAPPGSRGSGGGTAAVRIRGSRDSAPSGTEGASSPPSSLRTVHSGLVSYPSHLEVSASPTALYEVRSALRDVQDPETPSPRGSPSEERRERTLTCEGACSGPGDEATPGLSPDRAYTLEHSAQRRPLVEKPSEEWRERTLTCGGARSGPGDKATPGLPPDRADVPDGSALRRPLVEKPSECASPPVAPAGCGPPRQRPPETAGSGRADAPESAEARAAPGRGGRSAGAVETPWTPPSASASLSEDRKPESPEARPKQEEREKGEEEEEEEEFFSFVILHSPADEELAGRLQERLEALVVGPGATFNEDFAVPGKHRLSCVDDAINNSAFTLLLLSRNFNPRMLEFESNCALMSSLEKRHKSNTVIPLLPSENRLPRERLPASLRIFVPLEEGGRGFDRKARKAMAPDRIARQRSVWRQERRIRAQRRRERRAREDNERSAELLRGTELLQDHLRLSRLLSDQQRMLEHYEALLGAQPGAHGPWYPVPLAPSDRRPNIHIANASYVMIGNDSQMTVGTGGERPPREGGWEGPGGEEWEEGPRGKKREEGAKGEEQEST
ncbi:TIR domain-containing adapter molecule 1 [Anguilla rostrata]|uniref:TIR domain-containing adapter molecule 1 n=1 Tax=Anguilla rostrata TaxID=7938 RepID=UPI0030D0D9E6